ncbi:hypothetical protein KOR34_30380 [Posidoniimonas corsicana]|uniref:Glucose/Sorbosone dehydrogenase domain-containing protein n=1 Tax=Posidoniimonas corsicana TaxID=1938618 RepID=A0A5C5VJG3_9BACT|nr:PQQ-dependent sugar dehydrogenase [Posidoniimonas corsicana]TWT38070.1 hypothetical protein KOR34_30380 [Posidoniimonas corsicana]
MVLRFGYLSLLSLVTLAGASAQTVSIGGHEYLIERIGGVEIPGAFNDPGDFTQPTYVTQAPNDNNTLYIVERTEASNINSEVGRILRFDPQTNASSTYLDLHGAVNADGGIATLAFHPDFGNNGLFYVAMNSNTGGGDRNRLLEFHDSGAGAPTLSRTLLDYPRLANNFHTINWVGFQPGDASHQLYVTTGDGGTQAAQTQFNPALIEDPNSPYGKILRFDLEADFASSASDATHDGIEVVSLGHRNPYRASFDQQGNLFFAEVGFNQVEELNFLSAEQIASPEIEDYGWTAREGTIATPVSGVGGPKGPNDIDPFFDYLHPGVNAASVGYTGETSLRGQSVTGGYLINNRYFFGDFVNGTVYSGAWDGASLTDIVDHTIELEDALNDGIAWVASFSADNAGNLYILDFGDNFFSNPGTGEVFKLSPNFLPGDYNDDGAVDAADYTAWRDFVGRPPGRLPNDIDGGVIGEAQYLTWRANYGRTLASAGAASAPEPAAVLLAAIAAGVSGRRRR